jgi:hypothetical protein
MRRVTGTSRTTPTTWNACQSARIVRPHGRRPEAEALAAALVDHGDEVPAVLVGARERPALDELELQDVPELTIRTPQARLDLPPVDERRDRRLGREIETLS